MPAFNKVNSSLICFNEMLERTSTTDLSGRLAFRGRRESAFDWTDMGDEEGLHESEYSSALLHAAYSKNVEILKPLKPNAKKDYLNELLKCAAGFGRVDVVRYLLELGAEPNEKANGGSSALDRCLSTSLQFGDFGRFLQRSSYSRCVDSGWFSPGRG